MIIDAHAHACGELGTIEGITAYLERNNLDRIVLCPGEKNSNKNYPVPMVADIFRTAKIGYGFNKVIRRVVKLSGAAKTIHEQNTAIANMAKAYPWPNITSILDRPFRRKRAGAHGIVFSKRAFLYGKAASMLAQFQL